MARSALRSAGCDGRAAARGAGARAVRHDFRASRRARRPMCRAAAASESTPPPSRSQQPRNFRRAPPAAGATQPPSQPLPAPMSLPPSSRPGAGAIQSAAAGAAARRRPVAPQPPPRASSRRSQPRAPTLPGLPPGQRQPRGTPGQPADTAPQPGDEVVIAPPPQTHRQSDRGVLRSRQDHRPHHLVRRRDQRDGAVRRAAGDAARLLHAPADRDAEHRRLRRGRRDHAAGRDQAHLHRLDVRREPGPARASSIRSTTCGSPTAKAAPVPARRRKLRRGGAQPPGRRRSGRAAGARSAAADAARAAQRDCSRRR